MQEALWSSAHGAGRALSRGEARRHIGVRQLDAQTRGIWFDTRLRCARRLQQHTNIGDVMRAQRALVRVVRRLAPVLV